MTFFTGLSSLRAHQTAMSVVGNNIANASTEGFRREQVVFVESPHVQLGGLSIGTGVSIADIRRIGDDVLESALRDGSSNGAELATRLQNAKRIESLFLPGTGTLQERTESFFLNLERLSALPTDAALRSAVVHSAGELSDEINRVSNELSGLTEATDLQIQQTIEAIKELSSKVAEIQLQIVNTENSGQAAYGLRNQRDQMLRELSTLIDVERIVTADGDESFVMGGIFSVEKSLSDLQLVRNDSGELELWKLGCDRPHEITGGRLAGLLNQNNGPGGIEDIKGRLGEFVGSLARFIDGAHAIGVGIGGAFDSLHSSRSVGDAAATLSSQELITPIEAGTLHVSINDTVTGSTTLHEVLIDPSSQSLDDVAQALGALSNLSTTVDNSGRLSIVAAPGFTFDLTGNLQTHPDPASITGTSRPTMSGRYTGTNNDEYQFRFTGSGTVGVTEGLQVEVLDQTSTVVRVLDVGKDYEPDSDLLVGNGVSFSLTSGTVAAGDSFQAKVIAQPDETGFLSALGLNTLFAGNDASTIQVNPLVAEDPFLFATTTNEDPSDTRNLLRMLGVRDARVLRDGTVTMEQYLSDIATNVGSEVNELTRDVEGNEEHQGILEAEVAAVSGVDVNEELARMLQYQRSYQAAARYIATLDQLLQQLFSIIQ